MPEDFYDLLGVDDDASADEVDGAFRERSREFHPDVNDHPKASQQFKTLKEAHEVLSDGTERARYDRLGHRTYVDEHLEGLPTMSTPSGRSDDGSGAATGSSGPSGSASGSTSTSRSAAGAGSSSSGSAGGSRTSGGSRSARGSHTSGSRTASNGGTASGSGRSGRRSRRRTAGGATGTESDRSSAAAARRRGLRRGWVATVLAVATYLAGLWGYATATGAAAQVDDLVAAPAATLSAPSPLAEPATVVRAAALPLANGGTPGVALLFAAGVVALPLAVGGTVWRYGQGTARLYALAALAPVAWLAAGQVVAAPLAAELVCLVALPLLGGIAFAVDVGRYLLASESP